VRPEPVGGASLPASIMPIGLVSVGVLDLTGSENGKWSEPTTPGTLSSVKVRVLVSHFRILDGVGGSARCER